jgi:hypothetical protein
LEQLGFPEKCGCSNLRISGFLDDQQGGQKQGRTLQSNYKTCFSKTLQSRGDGTLSGQSWRTNGSLSDATSVHGDGGVGTTGSGGAGGNGGITITPNG